MWIVRLALGRPYTFVVMAILIAILGTSAIVSMPVDIFPYIDIPVVSVLWVYTGLSPEEMEKRVVTPFERSITSNVNDIEHIESQAYSGYAVIKIYFHPNVKIDMAVAQTTATMQTSLRQMPTGMFPANILKYDAASVPILQLGLSSKTLREQEIFDIGNNFIRTPLGTVQGASVSYPFGGKQRAVMVDLNLEELYAKQLSPIDVSNALNLQNLVLPAGTAKLARTEYQVRVNSSPVLLNDLNNLPIKTVNGATVYIKDVAQVRDGFQVQNNIVRTNGSRGVLITITRNGKASTLSIVGAVKAALPRILANVPPELKVVALADQSVFVRASIEGVLREALIAAGLTGMMILLFLGSWRSTLIVCISIPLSILTSLCLLSLLGQTINVMTLGGLALAVGILVDDATVEIENTHRNIAMRKPLVTAVLDGASQIAVPTFVATLAICIVFVPVLLLTGTAQVSVYAAGDGGGLRHAGVLSAIPHAGAHHDGLLARVGDPRGGNGRCSRPAEGALHSRPRAIQPGLRSAAVPICRPAGLVPAASRARAAGFRELLPRIDGTRVACRPGFLPRGRFRPDASARARSGRYANRRDGDAVRGHRRRDPRRDSTG